MASDVFCHFCSLFQVTIVGFWSNLFSSLKVGFLEQCTASAARTQLKRSAQIFEFVRIYKEVSVFRFLITFQCLQLCTSIE